jgi:hypothetical protein
LAVDVHLTDKDGKRLDYALYPSDSQENRLYPDFNDPDFPLLGNIDEYGATSFDSSQMVLLLWEWKIIKERAFTTGEQEFIDRVESLALRCQQELHTFLVFFGD